MRTASLIMLSGLFVQVAHADEIRDTTFPNVMLGTWAETAEQCAAKDKTNIVIEPAKYRDGGGDCAVRWIVETAGSGGINYAVHSLCISASLPQKTQTKDIIVRPLGPDRAAMGQRREDREAHAPAVAVLRAEQRHLAHDVGLRYVGSQLTMHGLGDDQPEVVREAVGKPLTPVCGGSGMTER